MGDATETSRPRLAVIFDFDDTLAPDSSSGLLRDLGHDPESFWREDVQALLTEGWDPVPAYLFAFLELSRQAKPSGRITAGRLADWGRRAPLFPGVPAVFGELRTVAADAGARLEFYVISSGLRAIIAATPVAVECVDFWASEFACGPDGAIVFPKNIVSFSDKTRYAFQVSKGQVGPEARRDPFLVNRRVAPERFRVPFSQMLVVGDGFTDVPLFSMLKRYGTPAIGVHDPAKAPGEGSRRWLQEDRRVSHLLPADYRAGSELHALLCQQTRELAERALLPAEGS